LILVNAAAAAGGKLVGVRRKTLAVTTGIVLVALVGIAAATRSIMRPPDGDTVAVSQGEIEVRIEGPGTVQARVPVTVSARIAAQVDSLYADHGDRVKRGQLLAVLDDRDLAAKRAGAAAAGETVKRNIEAAQASLAKAQTDLELARNRQRRDLELYRSGFISESAYETSSLGVQAAQASARNAEAQREARESEARSVAADARYAEILWSHTRITAPLDALVIQRAIEVGSTVAPGATAFRLVDPATLWVAARIDESQVGRLAEGMAARVRLRSGEQFAGRVARISRQSDAATRELDVFVSFDAPPERFAIDQEAQVSILAGIAKGPVVPLVALVRVQGRQGVMIMRDGRKEFQPVRIAASDGERAVIADGLDDGARLAAWTSR
jgi:HlyD family secretion protein